VKKIKAKMAYSNFSVKAGTIIKLPAENPVHGKVYRILNI
jgi:hypothetical protein